MTVAAIVVAAGRSERFGDGNKLLADFNGKPVVAHVVAAARAANVCEIVLVTSAHASDIVSAANDAALRVIVNSDPDGGMSSSIRSGLAALAGDCQGALIMLADMPLVSAPLISALAHAFTASGGNSIVYPQARDGRQGNPVLWPRDLFADLSAVRGDRGGKSVLTANSHLHLPVPVEGVQEIAAFADIDTPADLLLIKRAVAP